jgi:hypothetical protein
VPAPEDDVHHSPAPAPERVAPRKLALRVNGTRPGTSVRPTEPGVVAIAPTRRFGLRVNTAARAKRP